MFVYPRHPVIFSLLSKVFGFHYHSQEVIGSPGYFTFNIHDPFLFFREWISPWKWGVPRGPVQVPWDYFLVDMTPQKNPHSSHLKMDGFQYDCLVLGPGLFSGVFAVSFKEGTKVKRQSFRCSRYIYLHLPPTLPKLPRWYFEYILGRPFGDQMPPEFWVFDAL